MDEKENHRSVFEGVGTSDWSESLQQNPDIKIYSPYF